MTVGPQWVVTSDAGGWDCRWTFDDEAQARAKFDSQAERGGRTRLYRMDPQPVAISIGRVKEQPQCSTPSPATVVPPDRETWDILCAYLAGEEHHGSEISEGRLAEILRHRIGWSRYEVRDAWFDAVARGNELIEADHERRRPLIEAEAARRLAEIERRNSGGGPAGSGCSS